MSRSEAIWLDLKMLGGSVTLVLPKLRALSAVLISLWDVDPLPSKAGTRLANMELAVRPKQQRCHPRVRMLIENPAAGMPLTERQHDVLCQLL